MAPSATGPVTPNFGLPTLSTGADAPDGVGINNIITAIDTAMFTLIPKSLGTTAGDLIYFSGASTPARLAAGANTNVLTLAGGLPTWAAPAVTTYRKNTVKTVANTTVTTDLLNGEITLPANALSATGVIRFTAWGSYVNNTGSTQNSPAWNFSLGGTAIFQTGVLALNTATNAANHPWRIEIEINAQNSTSAQYCVMEIDTLAAAGASTASLFGVGTGVIFQQPSIGGYGVIKGTAWTAPGVNMTLSQTVTLSIINPVASANFSTTLGGALLEIL